MKVKLPKLSEITLANGLKIIISKKSDLPLVYIEAMVKFGASNDPFDLSGIGDMTVKLACRGSKNMNGIDLDFELDKSGIDFFGQISYDASFFTISGLSEDTQKMLSIMRSILKEPLFANEELVTLKKRRLAQLAESENNSQIIADKKIGRVLYEDHPYGYPIDGTSDSIKKIRNYEIKSTYKRGYLPNKTLLLIIGDIQNEDHIIKECEKYFSDWLPSELSKSEKQASLINPISSTGCKIWLIDKPELTQAQIRFSHLGIEYKNADFFPILLMNYILGGGGFASRLMTEIRSNKGYTYGISSSFIPRLGTGPFIISTHAANEKVEPLFRDVVKTINQFIQDGPKEQELKEAKEFFLGNFPLQFDTLDKIAGKLLSIELFDLGRDYIKTYSKKIAEVELEKVCSVAKKYLHPENFKVVVVGKKAEYSNSLAKFGVVF